MLYSEPGTSVTATPPAIKANVFSNDGSFLEKFRKMQEEQKRKSMSGIILTYYMY